MSALSWGGVLVDFEAFLATTDRAPATCEGYVRHVGWLAEAAPVGPWELTGVQLGGWLDERPWSRSTRRKVLTSLRVFYGWATAERLCEWAPTAGLPSAANKRRGPAKRPYPPAWAGEVEEFATWLRSGARGEGTILLRLEHLSRLSEVLADPWNVTGLQLSTWLSNPDWAPETKRSCRSTLRAFYGWGVKAGRLEESPAEDLETVLVPRGLPKPAPDQAVKAALAAADDRMRLALMLAAFGGLRRTEIASLHTSQITDDEILVVGKAGHHRRVPVYDELRDALRAEMARRRDGRHGSGWGDRFVTEHGFLFPSDLHPGPMTPKHLGKLMAQALPEGWTAHSLRHRFATATYAVERDLRTVQELLGHAKPETTARYAAVPDGAKRTAVAGVGLRW